MADDLTIGQLLTLTTEASDLTTQLRESTALLQASTANLRRRTAELLAELDALERRRNDDTARPDLRVVERDDDA